MASSALRLAALAAGAAVANANACAFNGGRLPRPVLRRASPRPPTGRLPPAQVSLGLTHLPPSSPSRASGPAKPTGYNYNNVPGKFSTSGTILGLRVGGTSTGGAGASALAVGVAQPLFIDEINVATGAIVQTLAMPTSGTTLGKNLACTLTTGMFASNNWK